MAPQTVRTLIDTWQVLPIGAKLARTRMDYTVRGQDGNWGVGLGVEMGFRIAAFLCHVFELCRF